MISPPLKNIFPDRTYRKRQVLNELDELRKKVEKERKAVILKSAVDNS